MIRPTSTQWFLLIVVLILSSPLAYSQGRVHTVILYVHSSPDPGRGTHVFDGAVIEARRVEDGERRGVQRADGNGRVIFRLPPGTYRFGPAKGLERRLRGGMNLTVYKDTEAHLELALN